MLWPRAETLADERGDTTAVFLTRALASCRARGVRVRRLLTDNRGNYWGHALRAGVRRHRLTHRHTRPFTPRTNGNAERFIRTLFQEWAHAHAYGTSAHRARMLPKYVYYFTTQRRHDGLHGQGPAERLAQAL